MTPAEITALINTLVWPVDDCPAQLAFLRRLPAVLEQLRLAALEKLPIYLFVESISEPTLADWQQAWLDAGRTLPIDGETVLGVWSDGGGNSASYIWYNDAMTLMMAYWWPGSSQFFYTMPGDYINSTSVSTTEATYINVPLNLARTAKIISEHAVVRNETVTTLQWGSSYYTGGVVTEGIILPDGNANSPRISHFMYTPSPILHPAGASVLPIFFRTMSGTGTALFTNTAATRKLESGFYPHFLGEGYSLNTEAIYS